MATDGALATRILRKILDPEANDGGYVEIDVGVVDVRLSLDSVEAAYLHDLEQLEPDEPLIEAAMAWPDNAHMIADMFRLGYLDDTHSVLDATYGKGLWWTLRKPRVLVAHDGNIRKSPTGTAIDFRDMPYREGQFHRAVYDPPYVCPGGRDTSTVKDMLNGFGLLEVPPTPFLLQHELVNPGLTELARVIADGGLVLAKTMNYNWGGQFWPGVWETLKHAHDVGFTLEQEFAHLGDAGPQPEYVPVKEVDPSTVLFDIPAVPKRRETRRARHTHSTLLVLRRTPRAHDRLEGLVP